MENQGRLRGIHKDILVTPYKARKNTQMQPSIISLHTVILGCWWTSLINVIIHSMNHFAIFVVAFWFPAIPNEATIADAILDRLSASAHRIELTGPSMRKK
jgi:hypothetical protein